MEKSSQCDVLFVCMGNICRSPLAEGIASALCQGWRDYRLDQEPQNAQPSRMQVSFDSAGISGYHRGESPCRGSQEVAQRHNIDISALRSRPVRLADAKKFHYLIAMDQDNVRALLEMGFSKAQVLRMGDFGNGLDIPDPYYYRNQEGFEMIFEMLYINIKNFLVQMHIL